MGKKSANALLGRPTLYRPEYCDMLIEHMSSGLSYQTFAAIVDVNIDTLYEWERKNPDFSEAKKRAFAKCQLYWEKLGRDRIINTSSKEYGSESLNTGVWVFNMKNRFKWTDKVEVVSQPAERELSNLSDQELDEILE